MFLLSATTVRVLLRSLKSLLTSIGGKLSAISPGRCAQLTAYVDEGIWRMQIIEKMTLPSSLHLMVTPLEGLAIWYANSGRLDEFEELIKQAPQLLGPNKEAVHREHDVSVSFLPSCFPRGVLL